MASWGFEIEPDGDGTVVRQWAKAGTGRSPFTEFIEQHPDKEGAIVAHTDVGVAGRDGGEPGDARRTRRRPRPICYDARVITSVARCGCATSSTISTVLSEFSVRSPTIRW